MLNLQIITNKKTNPRWRMDILNFNEISYYEKEIIDDIAMTLEKYNAEIDEKDKKIEMPFN